MLKKHIFFIACLFLGFEMIAQTSLPGLPVDPPPGQNCCRDLEVNPGDPGYDEYLKCTQMEANEPGSYCNPIVPIDNSIYILMAGVSGVVLASLAMYKKVKYKKTPM